jgi:hypothetical protein
MALFSAGTVAVAFYQKVYAHTGSPRDEYLTTVSACLGIFLLVISLIEWGAANGEKSEALHHNAEQLNAFARRVRMIKDRHLDVGDTTWADAETLTQEYERIKQQTPHNHKPIDNAAFVATNRNASEFLDRRISAFAALRTWALWSLASTWYLIGLWCGVLILLGCTELFSPATPGVMGFPP